MIRSRELFSAYWLRQLQRAVSGTVSLYGCHVICGPHGAFLRRFNGRGGSYSWMTLSPFLTTRGGNILLPDWHVAAALTLTQPLPPDALGFRSHRVRGRTPMTTIHDPVIS